MSEDIAKDAVNDIVNTERAYITSEVASMLDLAVPTVRKYAQQLESKGYIFIKGKKTGSQQARLFTEKDVSVLRYFKEIREKSNIKVEEAASIIIEKFGKGAIQSVSPPDTANNSEEKQSDKQYDELKDMIQTQNDLIKELTKRLDQQQGYIEQSIEKRDRLLLQAMEDKLEARRQIAAAEEEEKKKGFFARLFKKD